ncbi:hypothetical protein [Maribellus maritimus]|uniref:hypothetical protein n=1 Tax=Maribellus maritimus TaxID=2870838 RepID=UPI00374CECB9|nr:DUF4932 domain-containing protein [Maribellus maritimus]
MLEKFKSNKNDVFKPEFNRGFIYIYDLDSLMEGYESSRNIFKKYEDFYPEIINYFDDRNAKQ